MGLPRIKDFRRVVFFTGAGMSAESGIPTYRGKGGIWGAYDWEEYACERAFARDPEKVWDFHDVRRKAVAAAEPNVGHRIVAQVEAAQPDTWVLTQNIDGLHRRAGTRNLVELHGSLWRVRCAREGKTTEDLSVPIASRRCVCGAYLRPDIVWFEDALASASLEAAERALEGCDLLVSVGTSAVVYPAAQLPVIAMRRGAVTVEVNPEDTPVSERYQHRVRQGASAALASLWEG
jgi:NAD-dependent deacetylase